MSKRTGAPYLKCPRYKQCSVNNCPLHPGYPDLHIDPCDMEKKCTLAKAVRLRVAAEFPGLLVYEGLTPREFGGRERWNRLSIDEQEAIKNRGKTSLSKYKSSIHPNSMCSV